MNPYLELALVILTVYRLALMVTTEDGPADVFRKIRAMALHYAEGTWVERGLHCPLCVGFWLSVFGSTWVSSDMPSFFLGWFGIAGAQALLTLLGGIPESDDEEYVEEHLKGQS